MNRTGEKAWSDVPLIVEVCRGDAEWHNDKKDPDKVTAISCVVRVDETNLDPEKVRSGEQKADTTPYLTNRPCEVDDRDNPGQKKTIYAHRENLTPSQIDEFKKAGQSFVDPETGHEFIGGVTANLFKSKTTNRVLPNTKTIKVFDRAAAGFPPFDAAAVAKSNELISAAWDARNAEKQAEGATVEEAAVEATDLEVPEVAEAEADGPELG